DETLDDNEPMLIAALLDSGAPRRLHVAHPTEPQQGDTSELDADAITPANRARARDFGRASAPQSFPPNPRDTSGPAAASARHSAEVPRACGGSGRDALAIGDAGYGSPAERCRAMLAAASDSTPGDRAFAAAVYAIAKQEHLGVAAALPAGRVKVGEIPRAN